MLGNFKAVLANDAFFNSLLVLMVGLASFGLGRQSVSTVPIISSSVEDFETVNVAIESPMVEQGASVAGSITYVGSVNSDKYHLLWCSGAKTISEDNKIYFSSKAEAEAAGYKPSGNCKGI